MALLHLLVVAEQLVKGTRDEATLGRERHDVEAAACDEVGMRVGEEDVVRLVTGLRRQV